LTTACIEKKHICYYNRSSTVVDLVPTTNAIHLRLSLFLTSGALKLANPLSVALLFPPPIPFRSLSVQTSGTLVIPFAFVLLW